MSDYSILDMLQRRMKEALAKRESFPEEKEALLKRLAKTRENLWKCLGTMPSEVVSPELRLEAEFPVEGTNVIQERVVYRTEKDVWVPAHIYRPASPKEERLPGVLIIQGWDLDKFTLPGFKVRLAEAGYVVLFPDNRFTGERRRSASINAEQANFLAVSALFGLTFMGMNTWDNQRGLDVLAARPDVQEDKLGVVGLCWGGMQTWVLAALDERLKAACPVCSVSTFEALVNEFIPCTSGHACFGTYFWNWAHYGDIQDIIACIAPRPLLIQNNINDTWFPISGYNKVVQEVSKVYQTLGATEKFQHQARDTVHDITVEFGDRVIGLFNEYLKEEKKQ